MYSVFNILIFLFAAFKKGLSQFFSWQVVCCAVVFHVTIVAMDMGSRRNFGLFGNRLRSTHRREFLYVKLCRPAYFVRTTQLFRDLSKPVLTYQLYSAFMAAVKHENEELRVNEIKLGNYTELLISINFDTRIMSNIFFPPQYFLHAFLNFLLFQFSSFDTELYNSYDLLLIIHR